jgi:hypothetical protein
MSNFTTASSVAALGRLFATRRLTPQRHGIATTRDPEWLARVLADTVAILLLSSVLVVLNYDGVGRGTFGGYDEPRHMMDGVFFADFFHDLPLSRIFQYTVEYFIRLPALSLNWSPPMFSAIAGLVLLVGGLDPLFIRLLVLGFAVVGLIAWYLWASRIWGRPTAVLSALIFATNATVHFWTTAIMLEIPVVALINCTLFCLARYLERQGIGRAVVVGLLVAVMLLTKQTSLFILPAFVLYPILAGRADLLWSRTSLPIYALTLFALAILIVHACTLGSVGIAERLGNLSELTGVPSRFSVERWLLYARVLRETFDWPTIMLALIGCVEAARRRGPADVIILVWVALWYVAFTITSADPQDALRYATYVVPAISLLVARNLGLLTNTKPWVRHTAVFALLGLITCSGWRSYTTKLPAISDFRAVAQFVQSEAAGGPVLYCCRFDGEFIFERRRLDPGRRGITLRADKILVNFSILPAYGMISLAGSRTEILAQLARYGVGLLVIESDDNLLVPQFALLRKIVEGPEFDLLGEYPITGNFAPVPRDLRLRVYRYRNVQAPANGIISIPAPQFGITLQLRLIP